MPATYERAALPFLAAMLRSTLTRIWSSGRFLDVHEECCCKDECDAEEPRVDTSLQNARLKMRLILRVTRPRCVQICE